MSAHHLRILTAAQIESFHRDGYLVIDGFFSERQMDEALSAIERISYGCSFAEWKERVRRGENRQISDGISAHDNPGRAQFPTGVPALDRLVEDERFLDVVADIAGTEELSYLNGHLFMRSGPTDQRFPANPWEGYHYDHDTGSFLPPWIQPGVFDYLGCGVLLDDCDEDCAPTVLVPGSHRMVPELYSRLVREGLLIPPSSFTDIRRIPEFAERRSWTGKRGSLGISSSYLVHSAVPFKDPSRQRAWWTMSIARAADLAWNRFTTPFAPGERTHLMRFLNRASARVRSLFGWPRPGHPYYTAQTLEHLALQYPELDLTAYGGAPPAAKPYRAPEGYVSAPSGGLQRAS
jgi:hypothetical protein